MLSEFTFADFAKQCAASGHILKDEDIGPLFKVPGATAIRLYALRLAAYCAADMQYSGLLPKQVDDTDLIDATQECILHCDQIVHNWLVKPKHKFSTYASTAFRRIISDYLWALAKGGTDYARGKGMPIEALPEHYVNDTLGSDDLADTEIYATNTDGQYEEPPFTYRDPLLEVIAQEEMEEAYDALLVNAGDADETHKRNIRASKLLGLEGAKYVE